MKQQQLYEEEDFRAIEDDSDRQQRVYRGQPSTLGQVARDRDGISKHRNIIPVTKISYFYFTLNNCYEYIKTYLYLRIFIIFFSNLLA